MKLFRNIFKNFNVSLTANDISKLFNLSFIATDVFKQTERLQKHQRNLFINSSIFMLPQGQAFPINTLIFNRACLLLD